MLIELDIFSGRPNPRWKLDEPAGQRLVELQRGLKPTADRPPGPPGLGYRGFVYAIDDHTWRAFDGFVAGSDGVLVDPHRAIERWLVEQLPAEYRDLGPRVNRGLGSE
jgi:hypothetical protein